MARLTRAVRELQDLDTQAREQSFFTALHPGVKLTVTILYMVLTVSFPQGAISGLLVMGVYPMFLFLVGNLSLPAALRRLKIVLPLVLLIGIFNPILDRRPVLLLGGVWITAGMLSMGSLVLKAVLCVLSAYLLVAVTPMEELCFSLRRLGMPRGMVTVIMLIYRYLFLLLRETDTMLAAYSLRAPGQKGVSFRAWGPLAGNLLLRTMDRAETLYQSMLLRGFRGEYYPGRTKGMDRASVLYLVLWCVVLLTVRLVPVGELVGRLIL